MNNDNLVHAEEYPLKWFARPPSLSTNQEVLLPKMSHIISLMLFALSVLLTQGYRDEPSLASVPRGIEVVPFTTGMQYLESDDQSATIDLGEVIEVPNRAQAKDTPIAIAELRECGALGPDSTLIQVDCSDPEKIAPRRRVYLQVTNSYDPAGGEIITYQWEIIDHPMEDEFSEFDWQGQSSDIASFGLSLVGSYTVLLTVQNESGVKSGVTEEAKVSPYHLVRRRFRIRQRHG